MMITQFCEYQHAPKASWFYSGENAPIKKCSVLPHSQLVISLALHCHGREKHTNEYLYSDLSPLRIEKLSSEYKFIFNGARIIPSCFLWVNLGISVHQQIMPFKYI